jgi:hypothetical protein
MEYAINRFSKGHIKWKMIDTGGFTAFQHDLKLSKFQ